MRQWIKIGGLGLLFDDAEDLAQNVAGLRDTLEVCMLVVGMEGACHHLSPHLNTTRADHSQSWPGGLRIGPSA